jgi:hypothetical protein
MDGDAILEDLSNVTREDFNEYRAIVRCTSQQELEVQIRTQQRQVQLLCFPLSDQETHLVNTGEESEGIQMPFCFSKAMGLLGLFPMLKLKICLTFWI